MSQALFLDGLYVEMPCATGWVATRIFGDVYLMDDCFLWPILKASPDLQIQMIIAA